MLLHLHAAPKSHVAREVFGDALDRAIHESGVVPGGVYVGLAIDGDGVITGLALPKTGGVVIGGCEIFLVDGTGWKVPVALDVDEVVFFGFGDGGVVPDGFHDVVPFCTSIYDYWVGVAVRFRAAAMV